MSCIQIQPTNTLHSRSDVPPPPNNIQDEGSQPWKKTNSAFRDFAAQTELFLNLYLDEHNHISKLKLLGYLFLSPATFVKNLFLSGE